jgi:hypothetical protein
MKCQDCKEKEIIFGNYYWCNKVKGFVDHYSWSGEINKDCPLNQKKEEEKE